MDLHVDRFGFCFYSITNLSEFNKGTWVSRVLTLTQLQVRLLLISKSM